MAGEVDDADAVALAATQAPASNRPHDTDKDIAHGATVQSGDIARDATVQSGDVAHDATLASGETVASGGAPVGPSTAARDLPEVDEKRYTIGSEVGRGGLGRVLRARDEVLDRPVALKQLFASDDGSRRRFIREAMITARLQHPAIIPVYDAGRLADRSPFYAMKLVGGKPLDEAMRGPKTLAARLALLPTVLAVADAVAYAHSQRIIHRDLKPGNVLVGEFGETIVIDWGLAKDLSIDDHEAVDAGPYRAVASTHTVAGAVLGTPGYMAPEQAAGQEVDERADVYALGAILYHVVSGAIPHEGTTLDEVIERAVMANVRPLAEREPDTPPDLVAIVDKAMAKDPAARYRTARELAEDLRRYQTGQLVGAHHYTIAQRVRRWIRRHRAISAVVLIATVVLATFGAWSLHRVMAERDRADRERDEAVTNANRAILTQARVSLEQDPAAALGWLQRLMVEGGGWNAARTIAADALTRPLPEVLLHGTAWAQASRDGRYAVGYGGGGIWVAELVANNAPTIIPATFGASDTPVLEVCDDNRRAIVLTNEHDDDAQMIDIDLVARTSTSKKFDDEAWGTMLEKCRAAERLSSRGSRNRPPGIRFRDPASGEDKLLAAISPLGAWLTADGTHVVAIDDQGAFRRYDVKTGSEDVLTEAFEIGNDGTQPARASLSNDGMVVVAIIGGATTYCDFDLKFCTPIQGEGEPGEHVIVVAPDGSWARGRTKDRGWQMRRKIPMVGSADVPDGELFASADSKWLLALHEGTLTARDMTSGITHTVSGHDRITAMTPLPSGRVFTVGREGTARVTSLGAASTQHGLQGSWTAVFSPHTQWIVADGMDESQLLRQEIATGRREMIPGYDTRERPLPAVNDTGVVARVIRDGTVFRYEANGNWRKLGVHAGGRVTEIRVLATGDVLTVGMQELALFEATGTRVIKLPGEVTYLGGATLSVDRDERRALISCGEHQCVVDLRSGKIDVLAESVGRGVMDDAGRVAVTGGKNQEHLVWDLDTQRVVKRIKAQNPTYGTLGMSHDGKLVVLKTELGVELFDLASGERTPLRSKEPLAISWVMFSPNGKTILDNSSMLWDVASGEGRRLAPKADAAVIDILDDKVVLVTAGSIDVIADDLPRDPNALAARLKALPYHLDGKDTLVVAPH